MTNLQKQIDEARATTAKPEEWPMPGDEFLLEHPDRRVRAVFNGTVIADTKRPLAFIEYRDPRELERQRMHHHYWMSGIEYYFPIDDVDMEAFVRSSEKWRDRRLGTATYWTAQLGGRAVDWAAWTWDEPTEAGKALSGYITINPRQIDTMYEEDDEIPEGPRNPYHRVDVRNSARHVVVDFDGVKVADTGRARLLYETGLPTRYYIPRPDIRLECLEKSDLVTSCPYKGRAEYLSVDTGTRLFENVAWQYVKLYCNVIKLEHMVCFWPERGAQIYVDGELLPDATAPWPRKLELFVKATAREV